MQGDFTTPNLADDIMGMVTTPTAAEIEELIADTKSVEILQDNDYRRILLGRPDVDDCSKKKFVIPKKVLKAKEIKSLTDKVTK